MISCKFSSSNNRSKSRATLSTSRLAGVTDCNKSSTFSRIDTGSIAIPNSFLTAAAAASAVLTTCLLAAPAPIAAVAVPKIDCIPEVAVLATEPRSEPIALELKNIIKAKKAAQIVKPTIAPERGATYRPNFTAKRLAINSAKETLISVPKPTAIPIFLMVLPNPPE